jgi:hypothetical protein
VGESFFVYYFSCLVNGILVLDIHWGEEQVWDEFCFPQGEGDAISIFDIFFNKFA